MEKTFEKTAVLDAMNGDRFAIDTVGIEILDIAPGYCKTRLRVEDRHLNGVGITQGGALFTLADFTFAVASNTVPGETVVAIEGSISFLKPSRTGHVLTGEGREIARTRSLSTVEVTLTDEHGNLLARFHGRGFVRK